MCKQFKALHRGKSVHLLEQTNYRDFPYCPSKIIFSTTNKHSEHNTSCKARRVIDYGVLRLIAKRNDRCDSVPKTNAIRILGPLGDFCKFTYSSLIEALHDQRVYMKSCGQPYRFPCSSPEELCSASRNRTAGKTRPRTKNDVERLGRGA